MNDRIYYSREAEMQAMQERSALVLLFLALGLGIGAVLALMFAPASGKRIREDIAKNVEEGLHSGRENLEPVVKRLESEFAELRKNLDERTK